MDPRPHRILTGLKGLAPWASLALLAALLNGMLPIGQALWAKVITISGSAQVAQPTPTPTPTPTETFQGCSPGFWKQDQHLVDWPTPFAPEDDVAGIFGLAPLEGDPGLLDALQTGGGGVQALLRQGVAGLLNAAHEAIDYRYTVEEVVSLVQAAFMTDEVEAVKDLLEAGNEAGCPLPSIEAEPQAPSQAEATVMPTPSATPTEEATATLNEMTPPSETAEPADVSPTLQSPTDTPVPPADTPTTEVTPAPAE
ncbi:MAG TPA: hypothetical protein VK449_03860 [Anaerolineales bacterium]|nr:hypothetical protein [Anaerolineales bacterium]